MFRPNAYQHGHVSILGDDEEENGGESEPMAWTPENDPDQADYPRLPTHDEVNAQLSDDTPTYCDGGTDPHNDPYDGATEGLVQQTLAGRSAPRSSVATAVGSLLTAVREQFSSVTTRTLPESLKKRHVVTAIFIRSDGKVRILR